MGEETGKTYAVRMTETARDAIRDHARFIAVNQQSPQTAAEWLERVYAIVDGLQFMPLRHLEAEGYQHLPYVVRRVILDNHFILFTVNETASTVFVVGLRHGTRRPRPNELPQDPTQG